MEYATEGDPLRLALADSSRWHVTAFDSDLDISRHDDVDPV
jgi:hypothetical protein